ncbi:MAG: metallopeptidase family protein, partial [Proteobacteria bacterium]|nr:metallopeptidase family protein [Pseudomonadota bacterium]
MPVTQRSVELPLHFPNRVVIYQRNLERLCRSRSQLLHEIRRTVLHEVGHHFGLSERALADLDGTVDLAYSGERDGAPIGHSEPGIGRDAVKEKRA